MKKAIEISMLGGVNRLHDPRRIADDEVVSAKNIIPLRPGRFGKRPGLQYAGISVVAATGVPVSLYIPPFDAQYDFIAAWYNGAEFVLSTGGDGAAHSQSGVVGWRRPLFVTFGTQVFCYPGWPGTKNYVLAESGWSDEVFAGANNAAIAPRVAAAYRARMVYGNLGSGYENDVIFSDNYTPATVGDDVLASNSRRITVGARDGDEIVALHEVMLTAVGSPAQSALLVLKRYSAYLITGEPNQTADVSDFLNDINISRFTVNCGCASPWTVAQTPYGLMWAGPDNVWLFETGSVPRPVGNKIQPELGRCATTWQWKLTATYYEGFYRLMLPSETQGMDTTTPLENQWWMDLREGAPNSWQEAKWFGPQVYSIADEPGEDPFVGTRTFAVDFRPTRQRRLIGLEKSRGALGQGGSSLYTYDAAQPFDSGYSDGALSEVAHGIEIVTKRFDFGKANYEKVYEGLELEVQVSTTCQLSVVADVDGGDELDTSTNRVKQAGLVLGVDALDDNRMVDKTRSVMAYPDPDTLVVGADIQLIISDEPGYVVTDDNDELVFTLNGVTYTANLNHGLYNTIVEFCDEVVRAMQAVSGVAFTHNQNAARTDEYVRIQSSDVGNLWYFNFQAGADTATLRKSRMVGAALGYATDVDAAELETQDAEAVVPDRVGAGLELGGLVAYAEVLPRGAG